MQQRQQQQQRMPRRRMLATAAAAAVVALSSGLQTASATAVSTGLRLRRGNATASQVRASKLTLLSHDRRQPASLEPAFFKNPGAPNQYYGDSTAVAMHNNIGCHPKCWWTCGDADCDEVCDPVCAPPQCETACAPLNLATCRQQCDPPKCAIVCPSQHCEHGDCPMCKTVCTPPKCQTICAENCESRCAEPQCTWKCNPGKCEKPRCSLTCGGAKMCNFDKDVDARPEWKPGMHVVGAGLAAFDPMTLGVAGPVQAAMSAPAPAPAGVAASAPMSTPIR